MGRFLRFYDAWITPDIEILIKKVLLLLQHAAIMSTCSYVIALFWFLLF